MPNIVIDDEAHKLLLKKQEEFRDKKIPIYLQTIASAAIKEGVQNVEKRLSESITNR